MPSIGHALFTLFVLLVQLIYSNHGFFFPYYTDPARASFHQPYYYDPYPFGPYLTHPPPAPGYDSVEGRRLIQPSISWPYFTLVDLNQLTGAYSSSSVVINVPGYAQQLKGSKEKSLYTDRTFYSFRSVYYAEKPTKLNRFLPPVPKAPYPNDQIVDATSDNAGCPQPEGTEDCLSLNIFTPRLPFVGVNPRLPVMFWIHGGSNVEGKASEQVPTKLMEEDIVFVVIQYRLGPLGWLSLGTDEVPGNAAIFDMIEALRWVNKHIWSFGGDPNQVTIAGESAGSESVTLLLLAPQARGLFHRAIAESSTCLPSHSYKTSDQGTAASTQIAAIAGCPTSPYSALLDCVRNIDASLISNAYLAYAYLERKNKFDLGLGGSYPVIQTAGAQKVLEEEPRTLFTSGRYAKVPIMLGTNKQDGSFILASFYYYFLVPNNLVNNSTYLATRFVPDILKTFEIQDDNGAIAAEYVSKYLRGAEMGNFVSMAPGLIDIFSVIWVKASTYELAQILTQQGSNVFLYSFEFQGTNGYFDIWFPPPFQPPFKGGVGHKDELIYLFSDPEFPSLNDTEVAFSKQMIRVWTNFVKRGNPTPLFSGTYANDGIRTRFPKYSARSESYMVIDKSWTVKANYTNTYVTTS